MITELYRYLLQVILAWSLKGRLDGRGV